MTNSLLSIHDLSVLVDGKLVLEFFSMNIEKGQVVAIMGPNGSGKTTLSQILMGNPRYEVGSKQAKVVFDGSDLLAMSPDERARRGLYVAWQSPISIPGVAVFNMCRASYEAVSQSTIPSLVVFKKKLEDLAVQVGLTKEHISRDVNTGFSGGERKRLEMLQLLLLGPKLAILDEIDSGLDAGGVEIMANIVNSLRKAGTSIVLITHNKRLLDTIVVDQMLEMKHGRLSTRV